MLKLTKSIILRIIYIIIFIPTQQLFAGDMARIGDAIGGLVFILIILLPTSITLAALIGIALYFIKIKKKNIYFIIVSRIISILPPGFIIAMSISDRSFYKQYDLLAMNCLVIVLSIALFFTVSKLEKII